HHAHKPATDAVRGDVALVREERDVSERHAPVAGDDHEVEEHHTEDVGGALPKSGGGMGADRASNDADVSIALPKIPYGGFFPSTASRPAGQVAPSRASRRL